MPSEIPHPRSGTRTEDDRLTPDIFDGLARRRRGSSAWRARWTGSPGALSRSGHGSRRAACRPARAGRPDWWSCRSKSARWPVRPVRVELGTQDIGESAFGGFDDGAGVVCDQPTQHGIGVQLPGVIGALPLAAAAAVLLRRLRLAAVLAAAMLLNVSLEDVAKIFVQRNRPDCPRVTPRIVFPSPTGSAATTSSPWPRAPSPPGSPCVRRSSPAGKGTSTRTELGPVPK